jgi:putative PIN family toxin of toxin-antitoxin system
MNLVIDSSVFVTYGMFNKLYRIADAVEIYGLHIYVNKTLLAEVEKNLYKSNIRTTAEVNQSISLIKSFVTIVVVKSLFTKSPDPKDNFLFDLAIQTNSEVIVSQEKALLNFDNSPVIIHDIKWFKETYPVAL